MENRSWISSESTTYQQKNKLEKKLDKGRYAQLRPILSHKLVSTPDSVPTLNMYYIYQEENTIFSIIKMKQIKQSDEWNSVLFVDAFYEQSQRKNYQTAQRELNKYSTIYDTFFQDTLQLKLGNLLWIDIPGKTYLYQYFQSKNVRPSFIPVQCKYHRKIQLNSYNTRDTVQLEEASSIYKEHYNHYYNTILYYNTCINSYYGTVGTILRKLYPPYPTLKGNYVRIRDGYRHIGYIHYSIVPCNNINSVYIEHFIPNSDLPLSLLNTGVMITALRKIAARHKCTDIYYGLIYPHSSVDTNIVPSTFQHLLKFIKAAGLNFKVAGGYVVL